MKQAAKLKKKSGCLGRARRVVKKQEGGKKPASCPGWAEGEEERGRRKNGIPKKISKISFIWRRNGSRRKRFCDGWEILMGSNRFPPSRAAREESAF